MIRGILKESILDEVNGNPKLFHGFTRNKLLGKGQTISLQTVEGFLEQDRSEEQRKFPLCSQLRTRLPISRSLSLPFVCLLA